MGKTRKGKGTKLMLMTDAQGIPVSAFTTSAQVSEVHAVETLVDLRVTKKRPARLLYDKAADAALRAKLAGLSPEDRETAIVEELAEALQDLGGMYALPFSLLNESGSRTSHYLIFVSKHLRGYEIMKEVMAKQSSKAEQGVP